MNDPLLQEILKILNASDRPLPTTEVASGVLASRQRTISRLQRLLSEGQIGGRYLVTGGQGIWIWWRNDAFTKIGGD